MIYGRLCLPTKKLENFCQITLVIDDHSLFGQDEATFEIKVQDKTETVQRPRTLT